MPELDKPSINFWLALNLAQQAVTDNVEARLKARKLPPLAWFEVLFEMQQAGRDLRPFELQERLLFKQYNLSRLLARMVQAGVICPGDRPSDGRGKTFRSTEQGRKLSRQMWWAYEPILRNARVEIEKHGDIKSVTRALRNLVDEDVLRRVDPFGDDDL